MTKCAVIYTRTSSHDVSSQYLEAQCNSCRAYSDANGYNIVNVFSNTPFENVIEASKAKKFQTVIVSSIDRVTRNERIFKIYSEELLANSVKIESAE